MELEQAQKRVEELRAVIEKNNRLYYDQDAPELEDFEYDALTRELKELEAQFPQLVTPNSPTQHVGGTPSGRFAKVTHAVKMESLLDAFSFDELRDFDRRVREAGVEPEYVVEIKIDGLSCSLEYENGTLVRASTRGDGVVGEDVTANVKAIRKIPKQLKDAPEFLEVRGEVYMPHEAFQHLCAEQELQGAAPFKNPRNAAAGSLRQKDSKITGSRGLSIFIFNVQQIRGKELTTHAESLDYLKSLGLPVSPRYHVVHNIEDAIAEIEQIGQRASSKYAAGQIIEQSPERGMTREPAIINSVFVSTGARTESMPNLINTERRNAALQLKNLDLSLVVDDTLEEYSESITAGYVIRTIPEAGTTLNEGDSVTLVVSKGSEKKTVTVITFTGSDIDIVRQQATQMGLVVGDVSSRADVSPIGTVLEQSIAPNTEVKEGTAITFVVSSGPDVDDGGEEPSVEGEELP